MRESEAPAAAICAFERPPCRCTTTWLLRKNLFGAVVPVCENTKNGGRLACNPRNDLVDAARKVLDEMVRKGCHPDEVSSMTIVSA